VRDFITSATITALIDMPFGIIFIGVMAWISLPMIVPVLVGGIIMLLYAFSVQTKMHEISETMYRASAVRNATLIESLVGLETIKALGIEGGMQRKWEHSARFLTEVGSKLKLLTASINNGSNAIVQIINIVLVLLGVYLVINGDLTQGGLIASTMLASRALAPFAQTAGLLAQYHTSATALTSLDEVMKKPIERPLDSNFLSRPGFKGDIEFREVSFQYPGAEEMALTKLSFKIKAGEHVALLGRMGSGKTTIHKLILGLFQPTEGAILIDGIDSRQIDPAELRRCVGYVQQDTQLFYGTMRYNLTVTTPHADDASVLAAAHAGGIDEFINAHPKGFDLLVGERGETLSGGQKQGVGIARALVAKPTIILLDEPTSAMDHTTEDAVKRRLMDAAVGKTVLLITHRSTLFDMANRIIVIDSGRVVADGPKEQVVEALRAGKIGKAL
jgi:ATP-binding cassette subfamily C protein LapB